MNECIDIGNGRPAKGDERLFQVGLCRMLDVRAAASFAHPTSADVPGMSAGVVTLSDGAPPKAVTQEPKNEGTRAGPFVVNGVDQDGGSGSLNGTRVVDDLPTRQITGSDDFTQVIERFDDGERQDRDRRRQRPRLNTKRETAYLTATSPCPAGAFTVTADTSPVTTILATNAIKPI